MNLTGHLLVVAPHPDDETLALGGTIHDHLVRGGTCEIVAVTDGEAADDEADARARAAMAGQRERERAAALEIIGGGAITVSRLRIPDRGVAGHEDQLGEALSELCCSARQRHADTIVALPWRRDPHPDHQATARAGIRAAAVAGLDYLEVPIWGWYDRELRQQLPSLRVRSLPISPETRAVKRAALNCFTSQICPLPRNRGPVLPGDFLDAFLGEREVVLA